MDFRVSNFADRFRLPAVRVKSDGRHSQLIAPANMLSSG